MGNVLCENMVISSNYMILIYCLVMIDHKYTKKIKGINKNVVDNIRHKRIC